jgi:hypothetical protein
VFSLDWVEDETRRADRQEVVRNDYGDPKVNPEHNANGLLWALDNRIYTAGIGADLYLTVRQGNVDAHRTRGIGLRSDAKRRQAEDECGQDLHAAFL